LINHYTKEEDIVLDPFCGGGVTVVEGLLLKRRVIGVDINPLAAFITEMEVTPLDISKFWKAYDNIKEKVEGTMDYLYKTRCPLCSASPPLFSKDNDAHFEWIEWQDGEMLKIKYRCPYGHSGEKEPDEEDISLSKKIEKDFNNMVFYKKLWYPEETIPKGDKTDSIIQKGYNHFWQLFTKRNLLALSLLHKEILTIKDKTVQKFFRFALSGTLKWASKQSHLRGEVIEGWAMHAYWVYPKSLEINVWETFTKRCRAIVRGKKYIASIDDYYRKAKNFDDLIKGATALMLTQSSDRLPIPNSSIDTIITDPPYGGNVNYGELADYWLVWLNGISPPIMDKTDEAVINKTQGKRLEDYEEILYRVFKECHRVLKPEGFLVATFNSKDLVIISSFVKAVVKAGFDLLENGLVYQPPIRAYTTTVHAKEIGAFTGDFIFTFFKEYHKKTLSYIDERFCKKYIDEVIAKHRRRALTEIQFRRWVYEELIPVFARWSKGSDSLIYKVARYAESQIKKQQFERLPFEYIRAIARDKDKEGYRAH
jgi:SAM-dependent methyltransferase